MSSSMSPALSSAPFEAGAGFDPDVVDLERAEMLDDGAQVAVLRVTGDSVDARTGRAQSLGLRVVERARRQHEHFARAATMSSQSAAS